MWCTCTLPESAWSWKENCLVWNTVHFVWCPPKVSVWACTNGHLLPLQHTTYINTCMVRNLVCGVPLILYKEKVMHMHTANRGEGRPNSPPYTCWLLKWWIARQHFKDVGCCLWGPPPLSLPSLPGSAWEWWGSNTPVTLVSLLVAIHGLDQSCQMRVFSVGVVV